MNGHIASYDLSRLTVLIVDKHAPMRTLLRNVLRVFGVRHVYDAGGVEKGFEVFNDRVPDLVLVDWTPEFDGIGLVKRIRTDAGSRDPQVPIIMVTAYGETGHVHEAMAAGMTEYLVKPVSANMIYLRIAGAIENARPFVRQRNYTGPCRRRHRLPFAGNDGRKADANTGAAVAATPNKPEPVAPAGDVSAPAKAA